MFNCVTKTCDKAEGEEHILSEVDVESIMYACLKSWKPLNICLITSHQGMTY